MKGLTIITYTRSGKYITTIFFVIEAKTNIARTAEVATTPLSKSTPNFESLPQDRVVKNALK